jgi:hypothetical protein
LSKFIDGESILKIDTDKRVSNVLGVFLEAIAGALKDADHTLVSDLLSANKKKGGSLNSFLGRPPTIDQIEDLSDDTSESFRGGLFLLALIHFLKNGCHIVVIECEDIDLALDMFQSLNATGTPLTAFEVFKPSVIASWDSRYVKELKPIFDKVDDVFEIESSSARKEKLTDAVIVASAFVYSGEEIGERFSTERKWLSKNIPGQGAEMPSAVDFAYCIADQAEYHLDIIRSKRPGKGSKNFTLVNKLVKLGLTVPQAQDSAFCIFFLKDAGHRFAHKAISVFYSRLRRAKIDGKNAISEAAEEFYSVCKATAAFFTLWMGAKPGRHPDGVYRELFQNETGNLSMFSGLQNQNAQFLKSFFRNALASSGFYNEHNSKKARKIWVERAAQQSWFLKKAVCRFALLASAHDASPDLNPGYEGLFTNGEVNSSNLLNPEIWFNPNFKVIEHVATQIRPSKIEYQDHFDDAIYPGNNSVVDKIGNLTLLLLEDNSSIGSEWPKKTFYYWSLTRAHANALGTSAQELKAALKIEKLPPRLSAFSEAKAYVPHLAPLAYRGQKGKKWDLKFIEKRSEHLCFRVFDKLDPWLR